MSDQFDFCKLWQWGLSRELRAWIAEKQACYRFKLSVVQCLPVTAATGSTD